MPLLLSSLAASQPSWRHITASVSTRHCAAGRSHSSVTDTAKDDSACQYWTYRRAMAHVSNGHRVRQ
eukprot:3479445-Rhodomonas_salina.1